MPTDDDLLFLSTAVARGALDQGTAEEVLAALRQVEALGASSSAREIAINRGVFTREQADRIDHAAREGANDDDPEPASPPGRSPLGGQRQDRGPEPPTPIRKRRRLGNFEILQKLGVGGMGVVYKARQLSMDRLVALKVLPRRLARDRSFIERFLREARSAARLNHPHIVQGIDVGEAEGLYYFAMELVQGESLEARLRRQGRIPQREALQIARHVALALDHANAQHLIHRDIKPANILLTREGGAKLADLGLAKRTSDAAVTQAGGLVGTPLYMSPEQARGRDDIDARTDIYSLGATLYHAVVGSPPFTGATAAAIITQHLFEKPPSPRAAAPELTDGFCAVLMKMMAKQRLQRYQSAAELLEDIDRLLSGRPPLRAGRGTARVAPTALRRRRRRRRRSPIIPVFATTAIFILGASLWLLYSSLASANEPPPEPTTRPEPRNAYARRPSTPSKRPATRRRRQPAKPDGAAELRAARQWARAHPKAPDEAAKRFRAVADRYPESPVASQALAEAHKLEENQAADAEAALRAVCHEAKRLAAEHRYAKAVERLDRFGLKHREFIDTVSEERGLILSQALATDRTLRSKADAAARDGDYPAAVAFYRRIVEFGIPKLAARAKREIAILEKKHAAAQAEARRQAQQAYLELRLQWAPLLEKRKLDAVRRQLDRAIEDPELAPVRDALEADAAALEAAASVWAAAERGARAVRPKEKFSVGGIRGRFVKYADGVLYVQASGLTCKKPLRELRTAEVLTLARRALPDEPETELAAGLFYLAEGRLEAAERAFARAEKAGADPERHRARLERRRADAKEAEAEALFARLRELRQAEQWTEAAKALRAYREGFAQTRSLAGHRAELDELALDVRLATLDVTDLFHGACRRAADGRRIEVTYDLTRVEHLADWLLRGGDWSLSDGSLRLGGARAIWRAPGAGDIQAHVEVADASGPPGPWGLFLTEALDASPRYALALPERAGMQAVLRHARRDVAHGPAVLRVNQPRQVAFGIRSRRLAATLDGADLASWTDDSPEPPARLFLGIQAGPGRVLRARSVRIVALVPEPWLADELERLRLRLHKRHQLDQRPWKSLFNGATVSPWRPEHGNWQVVDQALTTEFGGNLVLDEADYEDLELRLQLRLARRNSVVRVSFRVGAKRGRYGLTLGCRRSSCTLALQQKAGGRGEDVLARCSLPLGRGAGGKGEADRVALEPGRWYDLRIVAIGSEIRAELDGSLLCLARDDLRHGGTLSLDVLHGGAAFRDVACRHLGREGRD
ncbi:MAG: protein kinase domain-containing protein [bacterium]